MPDTLDGGYILDDSGLKPYSVDDEDESKNKSIHGPKLVHKKIDGCYLFSFNSVLSSLLLSSFICPFSNNAINLSIVIFGFPSNIPPIENLLPKYCPLCIPEE